jgi:NOL1/NOP2/sun family putative RNA methylase
LIPAGFLERLKLIIPQQEFEAVSSSFSSLDVLSIRVNPLKDGSQEVFYRLEMEGALLQPVGWCPHAYIVRGMTHEAISHHPLAGEGKIYQQALSSMIPAVVLGAKPGERVLDTCAAPGSKTTQIAGMMQNDGVVVAIEAVKGRFFRLKSVCGLLGASVVTCKLCDARRFRPSDGNLFDKVLVDAPCSSEGRFKADDPDSVAYWSLRKVKEMSYKQKGILLSASRLVKPGGVLVYATCTFSPEENEEVVDWFLRKSEGQFCVEDAGVDGVPRLPCLTHWGKDEYHQDVMKCLRVKPDQTYTGFFIAKFRKRQEVEA